MIRISKLDNRRVEVSWDTGNDAAFLRHAADMIHLRNQDKERIRELEK